MVGDGKEAFFQPPGVSHHIGQVGATLSRFSLEFLSHPVSIYTPA